MNDFPRTMVGGVSLPRMIMGTNWVIGYSHTSPAADALIKERHGTKEAVAELIETYLDYGVDAIMAPFEKDSPLLCSARLAQERTGRQLILLDTPIIDVENTKEGRAAARARIRQSRQMGATFCMPHHVSVEQLVCKRTQTIDRLPDYLAMVREEGMIPGLSAHMPEVVIFSDNNAYDVETYIQIYNCMGFLMQVEIEYIHKVIWNAKKPVITIKSMAAGRATPFVGLTFSYATIRPCDMVTLGALTPNEVREDVEIALAALERRAPDLDGRASPAKAPALMGGKPQ